MKIEELIIDGFKSYAVRTTIDKWDPTFNAITGLNGSGKSNILDAICFVLGITNMSTVRAQNLQDLIYKRGQAGVTKASVTIVFDNKDTRKSPIGFEEYAQISVTRQIVMGGTSKYLINGHRAQQQTVQNLFQSVQLNINNPNFLIMQGRITKVLNMKPVEILAMLEEAAGTRMFEERKEKAFKTMAKKDQKVQEINTLLAEEIEPKLEKLRTEKRAFLEYQQTQSDLERLEKLVVAHDYLKFKEKLNRSVADLDAKKAKITEIEETITRTKTEISNLEEDIKDVTLRREKEMRKGGKYEALEKSVKEASHEVVRLKTLIDLKKGSIEEETRRKEKALQQLQELEKACELKKQEFEKVQGVYQKLRGKFDEQSNEAMKKEELLQTLSTGIAAKEGQDNGYMDQLQDARLRITQAATEQEQAKLKIKDLETRISKEEPRAKKAADQNKSLLSALENLRKDSTNLRQRLSKLGWEEGKDQAMKKRKTELQDNIRKFTEQSDSIKRKIANIDFSYSDPTPNFDRSQVKGLIAQLFTLPEQNFKSATALEICAGGRLYNVVVENEVVATQLLEKGKLRKRVTIIPLNKISAFKASAEKIGAAKKLAPGKVDLALSLVGYDDEITKAMEYVFGSTFICADAETAKLVTFNPAVRMRCVTVEGDVYDPSGTMSGGSSPTSSGILIQMQKLNEITKQLESCKKELRELMNVLESEGKKTEEARKLKQQLDLKEHEISLSEGQINSNSASKIITEVQGMKDTIVERKQTIRDAAARQDQAKLDAKRIEKDMNEFKNNKDSKLQQLQKQVDQLKAAVKTQDATIKAKHKEFQTLQLESEQLASDLTSAQEQLEEASTSMNSIVQEVQSLEQQHQTQRDLHASLSAEMDRERARITDFDEELQSLDAILRQKNTICTEGTLSLQKLRHEVEKYNKEEQTSLASVTALEQEYEWIADCKEDFGKRGTPYDFHGQNMSELKSSLRHLSERFQSMKKKVNPKVMGMIDSVEKKETALKNMVRTVIKDKAKIEETIVSLDEYKKEALHRTWEKVNGDFGQIFAELLPGNFAKLEPPEGKDVTEGLEVKVCLGKVWKQSLTELSGGQRSLIALALIMSLLQFKPAPMYILDEVDAALDLSHTQNIGRLIKTRFKGSQFIVVSLKEGMFTNANRIYRTRFVDGTSSVMASSG